MRACATALFENCSKVLLAPAHSTCLVSQARSPVLIGEFSSRYLTSALMTMTLSRDGVGIGVSISFDCFATMLLRVP